MAIEEKKKGHCHRNVIKADVFFFRGLSLIQSQVADTHTHKNEKKMGNSITVYTSARVFKVFGHAKARHDRQLVAPEGVFGRHLEHFESKSLFTLYM